jgi:uncharacterized protein with GYD domain
MHFILLVKFKEKPTKKSIADNLKQLEAEKKEGITYPGIWWTLGKYDAIVLCEAPNEKVLMKASIGRSDFMNIESLVVSPPKKQGFRGGEWQEEENISTFLKSSFLEREDYPEEFAVMGVPYKEPMLSTLPSAPQHGHKDHAR